MGEKENGRGREKRDHLKRSFPVRRGWVFSPFDESSNFFDEQTKFYMIIRNVRTVICVFLSERKKKKQE